MAITVDINASGNLANHVKQLQASFTQVEAILKIIATNQIGLGTILQKNNATLEKTNAILSNMKIKVDNVNSASRSTTQHFNNNLHPLSAMANAGDNLVNIFSRLKYVVLTLGAALGLEGGLKVLVDHLYTANKEMEQNVATYRASLQDLTGTETKSVQRFLVQEEIKTPFTYQELATSFKGLILMTKGFNESFKNVVKMTETLAAFKPNQGLAGAAIAMREALSGVYRSMFLRFDIPRNLFHKYANMGLAPEKVVEGVLKEMGITDSLVTRLAMTLSGRLESLKGIIREDARRLGESAFFEMSYGIQELVKQMYNLVSVGGEFSNQVAAVGLKLGVMFHAIFNTGVFKNVQDDLVKFMTYLGEKIDEVTPKVAAFMESFTRNNGLKNAVVAIYDFVSSIYTGIIGAFQAAIPWINLWISTIRIGVSVIGYLLNALGIYTSGFNDARDSTVGLVTQLIVLFALMKVSGIYAISGAILSWARSFYVVEEGLIVLNVQLWTLEATLMRVASLLSVFGILAGVGQATVTIKEDLDRNKNSGWGRLTAVASSLAIMFGSLAALLAGTLLGAFGYLGTVLGGLAAWFLGLPGIVIAGIIGAFLALVAFGISSFKKWMYGDSKVAAVNTELANMVDRLIEVNKKLDEMVRESEGAKERKELSDRARKLGFNSVGDMMDADSSKGRPKGGFNFQFSAAGLENWGNMLLQNATAANSSEVRMRNERAYMDKTEQKRKMDNAEQIFKADKHNKEFEMNFREAQKLYYVKSQTYDFLTSKKLGKTFNVSTEGERLAKLKEVEKGLSSIVEAGKAKLGKGKLRDPKNINEMTGAEVGLASVSKAIEFIEKTNFQDLMKGTYSANIEKKLTREANSHAATLESGMYTGDLKADLASQVKYEDLGKRKDAAGKYFAQVDNQIKGMIGNHATTSAIETTLRSSIDNATAIYSPEELSAYKNLMHHEMLQKGGASQYIEDRKRAGINSGLGELGMDLNQYANSPYIQNDFETAHRQIKAAEIRQKIGELDKNDINYKSNLSTQQATLAGIDKMPINEKDITDLDKMQAYKNLAMNIDHMSESQASTWGMTQLFERNKALQLLKANATLEDIKKILETKSLSEYEKNTITGQMGGNFGPSSPAVPYNPQSSVNYLKNQAKSSGTSTEDYVNMYNTIMNSPLSKDQIVGGNDLIDKLDAAKNKAMKQQNEANLHELELLNTLSHNLTLHNRKVLNLKKTAKQSYSGKDGMYPKATE